MNVDRLAPDGRLPEGTTRWPLANAAERTGQQPEPGPLRVARLLTEIRLLLAAAEREVERSAPRPAEPVRAAHPAPRTLLAPAEAAELLGLGRTRIFALIRTGEVESVKIGRSRRIPRAALDDYIHRLRHHPHAG